MENDNSEKITLLEIPVVELRNDSSINNSTDDLFEYKRFTIEEPIEEEDDDDNKQPERDLFQYIKSGDLVKCERTLANGVSPNTSITSGVSACHYAAFLGQDEILEKLIENGGSYDSVDRDGRKALDLALWRGNDKCVRVLLENLKNNSQRKNRETPKSVFITDCNVPELQLICNIWFWSTPLHLASARAHSECIQHLFDYGYDPNLLDRNGYSALDICGEGYQEYELPDVDFEKFKSSVQILVNKVRPRDTRMHQSNPLHKAVLLNSKSAAKLLVSISSYRNSFDDDGQTPLHLAVNNKKKSMLQIFKNTKDNIIDCKNRDNLTPLHFAIKNKWRKGVTILLDSGANILATTNDGDTALHLAALYGTSYILKDILEKISKNDLEIKNKLMETPLIKAIESGDSNRVKIFLNEHASINIKMKDGMNPLHIAVLHNKTEVLQSLLIVNSNLPNDNQILHHINSLEGGGMTALHLAAQENRLECMQILLEFDANLHDKTLNSLYTPLHLAAIKGHINIIEEILRRDPELIEERDAENWKPFYRSVHKGHRDCVTLFLKHGSDLSEKLVHKGRKKTVMELMLNNMPRSVNYLEELFDSMITKNECEINDEKCEITIDYSILMPHYDSKEEDKFDDQMNVVVALLNTGKRAKQRKLLLHPFIESFLYIKWMNGLRFFYGTLVFLYILFVLSMTWSIFKIYSKENIENWPNRVLWFFLGYLMVQEIGLITILLMKRKIRSYMKRYVGIQNWILVVMNIIIITIDHSQPDRDWPKVLTGTAILLAWLQITILLSHFPECGYTFQMFSTVAIRALKVLALFGMQVIIGFALAFWIMFHGQSAFENFTDSFIRTIVMTSEFDYVDLFDSFDTKSYRMVVQFVFVLFIFFVPIVMMNLIMALIISDTNDLKIEGKIKRLTSQVRLIDILESVLYFLIRKRLRRIQKITKIYPGKPTWEAISLVSDNIEESLFGRVRPIKNKDT